MLALSSAFKLSIIQETAKYTDTEFSQSYPAILKKQTKTQS